MALNISIYPIIFKYIFIQIKYFQPLRRRATAERAAPQ
jgi:hypothetical protein